MYKVKKWVLSILGGCFVLSMTACGPQDLISKITKEDTSDAAEEVQEEAADSEVEVAKPEFTVNLEGSVTYGVNAEAEPLKVEAKVSDSGTISYQWYRNMTNSNGGGTIIEGATADTYTPDTTEEKTVYYYVVATNTIDSSSKGTTSETVEIIVNQEAADKQKEKTEKEKEEAAQEEEASKEE